MANLQTLSLVLLVLVGCSAQKFSYTINDLDPEAKCLDGSSPTMAVQEGSDKKKILVFAVGRSACTSVGSSIEQSLDACARKTQSWQGSSNFRPPNQFNMANPGILSDNQTINAFATWTKIILLNCDGTAFQGNNKDPVDHKGQKLYFRGSVIMRSNLKWIDEKYGLEQADKIVFSGSSIGGIGVMIWIDYLKGLVTKPEKVYGIVDSAMFMDPKEVEVVFMMHKVVRQQTNFPAMLSHPAGNRKPAKALQQGIFPEQIQGPKRLSSTQLLEEFGKIHNKHERPPHAKCTAAKNDPKNDWKCMLASHAIDHLESKLLWIQPQYDFLMLKQVLQVKCITEGEFVDSTLATCRPSQKVGIDFIRSLLMHKLQGFVEKGHSVWSNACVWHGALPRNDIYYSDRQRASVGGQKLTIKEAVQKFVFDDEVIQEIDKYSWPYNRECAF